MKTLKHLTELTIKRSEWARRSIDRYVRLLDENGRKCCLGFALLAAGATEEEIKLRGTPSAINLINDIVAVDELFFQDQLMVRLHANAFTPIDSSFTNQAMAINDNILIDESDRELQLIRSFKDNGITLNFID